MPCFFTGKGRWFWSLLVNTEEEPIHDPIQGDENPRDHDNPTSNEQNV